jgi:hypothetical protein
VSISAIVQIFVYFFPADFKPIKRVLSLTDCYATILLVIG